MTFPLDDQDQAIPAVDLPAAPARPLSFGERFDASTDAARIRIGSWGIENRRSGDLAAEIERMIIPDGTTLGQTQPGNRVGTEGRLNALLAEANRTMQGVPEDFIPFPTDVDAFDAEVSKRLQAEYADTQDTLADAPEGSWGAEALSELWAGATDHSTILTLPIGGPATGSAIKYIGTGVAAGVAGEALSLPSQFEMADRLDIEDPDVAFQLGVAGTVSGVISGGILAGSRFLEYRRGTQVLSPDQRAGDLPAPDEDARVAAEEQRLRDGNHARPQEHDHEHGHVDDTRRVAPARAEVVALWNDLVTDETAGKIRSQPVSHGVQSRIVGALRATHPDLRAVLTSGGQDAAGTPGARRTGSTRHDHGEAGDLVLMMNGRRITPTENPQLYADFLRNAAAQGFTGLGHYSWGIHVGGGRSAAWGPSTTSSDLNPEFARAIREGWANPAEGSTPMGALPRTPTAAEDVPAFNTTQRGYTRDGTVSAGDDLRIDVKYEVVDAALLRQASGDLQPRNRGRLASDEQIAEIAASLDPARLMRSPEADRGAPIVGPDNVIESGNGRAQAIGRASERHPDRFEQYRQQILAEGFEIPEGVERPVLIARRTSSMTDQQRQQFVRSANTSAGSKPASSEPSAEAVAFVGQFVDRARKAGATDDRLFGDVPEALAVRQAADPKGIDGRAGIDDAPAVSLNLPGDYEVPAVVDFDAGAQSGAAIQSQDASMAQLRAVAADMEFELPDGTELKLDELLDDLDADQNLLDVLDACRIGSAA